MQHYDEFSINPLFGYPLTIALRPRCIEARGRPFKRIKCKSSSREHLWNTNFIHVTLIDYEGDAVVGLHRKKDGQNWIVTINNGDSEWWKHEKQLLGNKDVVASIRHWLHLFKQVQASRY